MIPSIDSIALEGKRVFLRVDFNVPLDSELRVVDDSRIQAALPTIRYAMEKGAKLVIASHLGRPKGEVDPKYSLLPVAERLSELLAKDVVFPEDCVGYATTKLVSEAREGDVVLLENLRFHPGETNNDPIFASKLAALADVYVNDAFGTLHRAHASTVGMVPLVAEKAAGRLVFKEVQFLNNLMTAPQRPFVAILGGAKVSDKLEVIDSLLRKVDALLIGGAMALTFLRSQGVSLGRSLVEENKLQQAKKYLERAKNKGVPIVLPVDHVISRELKEGADFQVTEDVEIPSGWMGVDVGPKTLRLFAKHLADAKTILWNGPVGAFEVKPFNRGSLELAKILSESSGVTLIGGGDSVAVVKQSGLESKMSHLSTGGGASLEFIEGKTLPGLKALEIEASIG